MERKKLLFAGLNAPATDRGGDAGVRTELLRHFVKAGYDVTYMYLGRKNTPLAEHDMARKRLMESGVSRVVYIEHHRDLFEPRLLAGFSGIIRKIFTRLFYSTEDYSPWREMAPEVSHMVKEISPDVCFFYALEVCGAFTTVTDVAKILGIGVFPHKNKDAQIRILRRASIWKWLKAKIDFMIQRRHYLREARELLASVDGVCAFAKNAETISKNLVPNLNVTYMANPIPDLRTKAYSKLPLTNDKKRAFRISLVGQLRATATLSGLDYFVKKIVPALKQKGVFEKFQFEIIGKFDPPDWLKKDTEYPNIAYTGFVEDLQGIIQSADVFLVPSADDLGNRSRIVSAWSIGCCVVCHTKSYLGMPELESGRNCLMGKNETEIVDMLIAACNDPALNKKLRENGRTDFERIYAPEVSFPPVLQFIDNTLKKKASC